eukprot:m.175019 g.175019  ORF g.175019 m.175019 type:complete len:879 (+) comp39120_c0_seq4:228-2864(+)
MPIILLSVLFLVLKLDLNAASTTPKVEFPVLMPSVQPNQPETYLCLSYKLPKRKHFVVGYEPHASQKTVHHILVYGCGTPYNQSVAYWNCGEMGGTCGSGPNETMFAWAKDAPGFTLREGVGFAVGGSTGIDYVVVEVHYKHPVTEGSDSSGVTLTVTDIPQPYLASVYLLSSYGKEIKGGESRTEVNIACEYDGQTMHPFAFSVHAHDLGRRITAYRIRNGNWTKIASGNSQNPQTFYPLENAPLITNGDTIAARCIFDASERSESTHFGDAADDEMCIFYMMYYTPAKVVDDSVASYEECAMDGDSVWESFPPGLSLDYDDVLGPQPTQKQNVTTLHGSQHSDGDINAHATEQDLNTSPPPTEITWNQLHQKGEDDLMNDSGALKDFLKGTEKTPSPLSSHLVMQDWPKGDRGPGYVNVPGGRSLGQVGGVSVSNSGQVFVFHRGPRQWGLDSFDFDNNFQQRSDGPIAEPTVAVLDSASGEVIEEWGENLFYLPHGITVDRVGNIWLTDVATHQVFKFKPDYLAGPSLTLGEKFVVGSDEKHFCKPAEVAVLKDGRFFVADGYCNDRIVRYTAEGEYDTEWEAAGTGNALPSVSLKDSLSFAVVHGLTVSEEFEVLCAADRENGRALCYNYNTGKLLAQIGHVEDNKFGGRLFSIRFSPTSKNMFAVNGPNSFEKKTQGFTIDDHYGVIDTWNSNPEMAQPHSIAVAQDGSVFVGEIGPHRVWKFQPANHAEAATESMTTNLSTTPSSKQGTKEPGNDAFSGSSAASPTELHPTIGNFTGGVSVTPPTSSSSSPDKNSSGLVNVSAHGKAGVDLNVNVNGDEGDTGFHPSLLPVVVICSLVGVPVLLLLVLGIACRRKTTKKGHYYQPVEQENSD